MVRLFIGLLLTAVWFAGTALALEPDTKPIWQKRVWGQDGKPTYSPLVPKDAGAELPLVFPGRGEFVIGTPKGLLPANAAAMRITFAVASPLPEDTALYVIAKDWDHLWRQIAVPWRQLTQTAGLSTGRIEVTVPLSGPESVSRWQPIGHRATWHDLTAVQLREWGVVFESKTKPAVQPSIQVVSAEILPAAAADPKVKILGIFPARHQVGERIDFICEVEGWQGCPFDPASISLQAEIVRPDGAAQTVRGFYFQDFVRLPSGGEDGLLPSGSPSFMIRYMPTLPGSYSFQPIIRVGTRELRLPKATLKVEPAAKTAAKPFHGFVHVDPQDKRFFSWDDGSFFHGVMMNFRSPTDARYDDIARYNNWKDEGLEAYERLFPKYKKAGINVVEIWMCSWWLELEWTQEMPGCHGIGWFNQWRAWKLDRIMEWAAQNDIHVILVLHNHGQFGTQFDNEWIRNPYNSRNGGWIDDAESFFSDAKAMEAQRRFFEYVNARWGWSPNLLSWKLFTEIDLTGKSLTFYNDPSVKTWLAKAATILKQEDVNKHPITIHWMLDYRRINAAIASLPEMDFITMDAYYMGAGDTSQRGVDMLRGAEEMAKLYKKPAGVTEFGGSPYGSDYPVLQAEFSLGPWIGFFGAHPFTPGFWWFPLVEEKNLYPRLTGFVNFAKGEDLRGMVNQTCLAGGDGVEICLLRKLDAAGASQRLLMWGFDSVYFYNSHTGRSPREIKDYKAPIGGLLPGAYKVDFWDAETGKIISSNNLDIRISPDGQRPMVSLDGKDIPQKTQTIVSGMPIIDLPIPPFKRDFALKMTRK